MAHFLFTIVSVFPCILFQPNDLPSVLYKTNSKNIVFLSGIFSEQEMKTILQTAEKSLADTATPESGTVWYVRIRAAIIFGFG